MPSPGVVTHQAQTATALEQLWRHGRTVRRLGVAVALGLLLAIAALGALWLLAHPLALLVSAVVLAEAVGPAVVWLERRLPRVGAIVLAYAVACSLVAGMGGLVTYQLWEESDRLWGQVPVLLDRALAWASEVWPLSQFDLLATGRSLAGQAGPQLLLVPLDVLSTVFEVLLVVIMSIYWSIAAPAFGRFLLGLWAPSQRAWMAAVSIEMGQTMGGYVRAVLLEALIVIGCVYGGLWVIGVPVPLALALLAGLFHIIPVVGRWIGLVPILGVALLVASPAQALAALVYYVTLQQVAAYVLKPKLVQYQADIPPLLVIFALLAGVAVGGILGGLVAVPLAGALRILVVRLAGAAVYLRRNGPGPTSEPVPLSSSA